MSDQAATRGDYSTQRLSQRYRFADPNMDLFFLGALAWGPAGGLSVGEMFYVASQIVDGDADSWAEAFERQGGVLTAQADAWRARGDGKGYVRAAGESRLEAFTCFRLAWQFVVPGERFASLFRASQAAFRQAVAELGVGATAFSVAYGGGELPGHYFPATTSDAPTLLILGGADTCHEDRFLSQGRHYLDRGYAVALVDLPGQGLLAAQGLHWEPAVERPLAAVVDLLVARFAMAPRRLALLGMSLGGYFACRAAGHEPRLAAVIATPALPQPYELFGGVAQKEAAVKAAAAAAQAGTTTTATTAITMSHAERNNFAVLKWKAGTTTIGELAARWKDVAADPSRVRVPFLTVLGQQEGGVWHRQSQAWHDAIPSPRKRLIQLGPATGADAHCQANNPLRLVQEVDGWLQEVLGEEDVEDVAI